MTPADLLDHLYTACPEPWSAGYYIESSKHGQPDPCRVYCADHADRVAHLLTRMFLPQHERRAARFRAVECWSGDDGLETCRVCGRFCSTGGLTDYGVRSYLDEVDEGCTGLMPEYLIACAESMLSDDPNWSRWVAMAQRCLADGPEVAP